MSSYQYRRPQRKQTTLPPYEPPSPTNPMSFYTPVIPVETVSAISHGESRRLYSPRVGVGTPNRRTSILSDYVYAPMRNLSNDVMTAFTNSYVAAGRSMFGGQMHTAPESITPPESPIAPAPPSYASSVKPMLLWLDGGGSKVAIQTHLLHDLMHKLGWDLKFTGSQPKRVPGGEYIIPPKDCFDWVGSCGCGMIIAFGIACGMRAEKIRDQFKKMTRALRYSNESELHKLLLEMIPTTKQSMTFNEKVIKDSPCLLNVWVPAETNVAKEKGISVHKGDPLEARLLPLVMREVAKEWNGTSELLDCTVSFLQDANPIFEECSFVLSLGSGEVPRSVPDHSWTSWLMGWGPPHPPLPLCIPLRRNHIIPPTAYNDPARYIRVSPRLATKREGGGIEGPDDWGIDVEGILKTTSNFISHEETRQALDHVISMLKWRDIRKNMS